MTQTRSRIYSQKEELANSLSHALGIVLGIGAAIIFFSKESIVENQWALSPLLFI